MQNVHVHVPDVRPSECTSEYGSNQLKVWVNGEGRVRVKMRLMVRVREQMSPQAEAEAEGRARHNREQEGRWREWGSWRGEDL